MSGMSDAGVVNEAVVVTNRRDDSIGTASGRGRSFMCKLWPGAEEKQHIELAIHRAMEIL